MPKSIKNRSENTGAGLFTAEVDGGPGIEGRRTWRWRSKHSFENGVDGVLRMRWVPYAQRPEGTVDYWLTPLPPTPVFVC